MTTWTNIAIFTETESQRKQILQEMFGETQSESHNLDKYRNRVVEDQPPTLMYGSLTSVEREQIAEEFLSISQLHVHTVVMVTNSDTADWATAYIYTETDDNRTSKEETISGESGLDGSDVKQELSNRNLNMSTSHHYNTLKPEDCLDT